MANTTLTFESIMLRGQNGEMITAYQIAVIINQRLREEGVTKVDKNGDVVPMQIRPQMMYNYDRNGLIVKGKRSVCHYELSEVLEFAAKYLKKFNVALFRNEDVEVPETPQIKTVTAWSRVPAETIAAVTKELASV